MASDSLAQTARGPSGSANSSVHRMAAAASARDSRDNQWRGARRSGPDSAQNLLPPGHRRRHAPGGRSPGEYRRDRTPADLALLTAGAIGPSRVVATPFRLLAQRRLIIAPASKLGPPSSPSR